MDSKTENIVLLKDGRLALATYQPNKVDGMVTNYTPVVNIYKTDTMLLLKKVFFQKPQSTPENALIISKRLIQKHLANP